VDKTNADRNMELPAKLGMKMYEVDVWKK